MFKLVIEIDEDGSVNLSNEGKMSPIIILGALRRIEHDLLMTTSMLEAEEARKALRGKNGRTAEGTNNTESKPAL